MARPKAPCGTYSAYKRHLRDGEPVDFACRAAYSEHYQSVKAQNGPDVDIAPVQKPLKHAKSSLKMLDELESNLELVRDAMERVAEVDPARLAPLSKRHSELLAEIAALSGVDAKEDPIDAFFNAHSNVIGITTAKDRKSS